MIVTNQTEQPITLAEAARFCRISESNFRVKVSQGLVPFHRPKGIRTYRFYKSELQNWIRSNNQKSHSISR